MWFHMWNRASTGAIGSPLTVLGLVLGLMASALAFERGYAQVGSFTGEWELEPERSSPIDPWRYLRLEIDQTSDAVTVRRAWSYNPRRAHTDSVTVPLDGKARDVWFPHYADSRHLGAYVPRDSTRSVRAWMEDEGETLIVESRQVLRVSQGESPVRIYSEYRLARDGETLHLLELRSTRPVPIHYRFHRVSPGR